MKSFTSSVFVASGIAAMFLSMASAEEGVLLRQETFIGGGDTHTGDLWAPNMDASVLGAPLAPGASVPEPASASLLLLGAGLLGMARRRTRGSH